MVLKKFGQILLILLNVTHLLALRLSLQSTDLPPTAYLTLQPDSASNATSTLLTFSNLPSTQNIRWSIHPRASRSGSPNNQDCVSIDENTSAMLEGKADDLTIDADLSDLLGNTLMLRREDNTPVICLTIDDSMQINQYRIGSFHLNPSINIYGSVFVWQIDGRLKIMAEIETLVDDPTKLDWAITTKWWSDSEAHCSESSKPLSLQPQSSVSTQITAGQPTTITIHLGATIDLNRTVVVLFNTATRQIISCAQLLVWQSATATMIVDGRSMHVVAQHSPYHPVVISPKPKDELMFVHSDTKCASTSENRVVGTEIMDGFDGVHTYSLTLFGGENTVLTRSVSLSSGQCATFLDTQTSTTVIYEANFFSPVIGHIKARQFESFDNTVLISTSLVHLFEQNDTHVMWKLIMSDETDLHKLGCAALNTNEATIADYPLTVHSKENSPTSKEATIAVNIDISVLEGRIVLIDLGWTQVCGVLRRSHSNVIHADIRQYSKAQVTNHGRFAIQPISSLSNSMLLTDGTSRARSNETWTIRLHNHRIDSSSVQKGGPCGWLSVGDVHKEAVMAMDKIELQGRQIVTTGNPHNWMGKSIVFTRQSDGEQMCGTLRKDSEELDNTSNLLVNLNSSWINGVIRFQSIDAFHTLIDVHLVTDPENQGDYAWQIINSDADDCASINQPLLYSFNPMQIDTQSITYASECSPKNYHLCTVGDLEGKFGRLSSDMKQSFVMPLLPIGSRYAINHARLFISNSNGDKLCVPLTAYETWIFNLNTNHKVSRADIQSTIHSSINQINPRLINSRMSISISYNRTTLSLRCVMYNVGIDLSIEGVEAISGRKTDIVSELEEMLGGTNCFDTKVRKDRGHALQSHATKPLYIQANHLLLFGLYVFFLRR